MLGGRRGDVTPNTQSMDNVVTRSEDMCSAAKALV